MLVNSDLQSVTCKMRSPGPLFHALCHLFPISIHMFRAKRQLVTTNIFVLWCAWCKSQRSNSYICLLVSVIVENIRSNSFDIFAFVCISKYVNIRYRYAYIHSYRWIYVNVFSKLRSRSGKGQKGQDYVWFSGRSGLQGHQEWLKEQQEESEKYFMGDLNQNKLNTFLSRFLSLTIIQ